MYYPDLESYVMYDEVFPNMINIGWLDKTKPYQKGRVSQDLTDKLRYLTLLGRDQDMAKYIHPTNIVVHRGLVRGTAFECLYCQKKIVLFGLKDSMDDRGLQLGLNVMTIPSIDEGFVYIFPTLLYHYIIEHHYLPPKEFLEALEVFDLTKPYNCNDLADKIYESYDK